MNEPRPFPICDFCSEPNPSRIFESPDFLMDMPDVPHQPVGSRGAWMACSTCGTFIDNGEWERLAVRALDHMAKKYPDTPRRILFDIIKRSHDLFREHYEVKK